MRSMFVATIASICAMGLFAQENLIKRGTPKEVSQEEKMARREKLMQKMGGFIHVTAAGPETTVVDMRREPGAGFPQIADFLLKNAYIRLRQKTAKAEGRTPLQIGREEIASGEALVAIVLAEAGAETPALSVFPEERIAVVNVDALGRDGARAGVMEARLEKEVWRAFGLVLGTGYSSQEKSCIQPAFSAKEIDAIGWPRINPFDLVKINPILKRFGVRRERTVPYRLAVRGGYAPEPTNDLQRAVWEEERLRAETNRVQRVR